MFNRISIPTLSGHSIPAIQCIRGEQLVLLCHGITSEKTERGFFTQLSARLAIYNFSTMSFDFRGHGDSAVAFEDATISDMVEDLIQTYLYAMKAGYKVSFVCISFGASIFLLAQSKFDFQPTRIVFLNPVTDYLTNFVMADTEWGRQFSPQLESTDFWLLANHKIPNNTLSLSRQFISELALLEPQATRLSPAHRALVLHGDADTVISQASAKRFVEKHDVNAVSFISIPEAEHSFPSHQDTILDLTCRFLGNE